MTYKWEFHPRRYLVTANNVTQIKKRSKATERWYKTDKSILFSTPYYAAGNSEVWKPTAVLRVETQREREDPGEEVDLILWAPSTRIRIWLNPQFFFAESAFVHTNPVHPAYESATFWIRSPEWKFLNKLWIRNCVNAKYGYFFYAVTSLVRALFFTANI